MKIAISGTTGLVGSNLKAYFAKTGHQVSEITRQKGSYQKPHKIFFDLKEGFIDTDALEGQDVIIHLAGANISDRRWTPAYKKEILASRIESTKLLTQAIKNLNRRPKIFLSASAVGYYGNHEPQITCTEQSLAGHSFLSSVCQEWENASADVILYGVRLVHMRFGVILSKKGGALAKMLPIFNMGLGGRLGSGRQKMSWVVLDEIPHIIDFVIDRQGISGAVNFVSPNAVTNAEFTKILGSALHRPTFLPAPAGIIKMMLGEMGEELLLEGVHVVPEVLSNAGYHFQHPDLKVALKYLL